MRVSVMLDTNVGPVGRVQPDPAEVTAYHRWFLDCARMLDGTAVDGVFVAERHGRTDCYSPAPLEQLAALAAVTEQLRLGTYVLMPTLYPPVALLERLAVVDHLSGGRLVCGLGVGFHPGYFRIHGAEIARRGAAMDEFLALLDQGWRTGHVDLDGEDTYVLRPAQQPRPPVWIGGTSAAAAHRAARAGDAFAIGFTDRGIGDLTATYRKECERLGRVPRFVSIQSAWVRTGVDARAEAAAVLGETLGPEMTLYQTHGQLKASGDIQVDRMLPYMYVGEPGGVIHRLRDDGTRWDLDEMILRVHIGIPSREAVTACLEHIAAEVAPALL